MPRVICTLENAGDEISGIKFHPLEDGGKVSDDISAEQVELFLSIPGYEPFDGEVEEPKPVAPPPTSRKSAPKKAAAAAEQPAPVAEQATAENQAAPAAGADEVF